MAWVDSQIAGKVYGYDDVVALAERRGCDPHDARWPDGSYQEMVAAGVAPEDPPARPES
jgi:hypothetical protein